MSDPLLRKLKRNEENRNRREKARKRLLAVQEATNNDWRANLSAKPSTITKTTTPQAKNSHNSFSNSKSPIVLLRQQSTESKKRLSFGNSPLKNTATTKTFTTSIDEKWLDLSPSQNETDQDAKMPKVSSRKSSRQEDSAKRLFFESPSRSTTKSSTTTRFSIGDEWLDSPRAKTKWEDSSKKLAASNPKSTSSSQDSQLLMSSKKPAPVKRRPPPQPLDDSSDEEPDLLGAFLEQQKRKKGGERPSQDKWKRTSHEFSSENAGKNSRSPSPPTRKSLGTSSIDEDAASPPPIRNSLNRSLMDDSSDEEDTSFTTRRKKRPLRNGDAIPHNPIALVNQERSRSTDMARESSPPQLKTSNASLWSDSENEEVEEEEEEYLKKKIKKKRKSSDSSSPQKRSKTTDLYDDSIEDCADNRELLAQDEETFRQTLKPELKNPYFGPFALEPLILEGGEDQQEQKEVPAALSRYLADFQREGVQFLYKCLSAKKGAILGHDMVRTHCSIIEFCSSGNLIFFPPTQTRV